MPYDKTIRDLFDNIFKYNVLRKLEFKALSDNIFLKEKYTDILAIGTEADIPLLKEQGYKETTYNDYTKTYINAAVKNEECQNYKIQPILRTVTLTGVEIGFSFKDNVVNITGYEPYKLLYSLEYDFPIDEFLIDSEGFVYIIGNDKLIKSHITLEFFKETDTHKCITKLEEIENFFCVDIPDFKTLLYFSDDEIYYLDKKSTPRKITLGKKYYFTKDNQVFFNVIGTTDKVTVQVEHLHYYDWISLLGLNNFRVDGKKLSTNYIDDFKNIMRFPFGSTLNGLLNYSDFTFNKSYKVDKDLNFIKILGNFNYQYQKGLFKIILRVSKSSDDYTVYFNIDLLKDGKCLKRVSGNTVDGIFYFCNLKFTLYKTSYEDEICEFQIEVIDDYSVKIVEQIEYIGKESLIDDFEYLAKIDQVFRRDSIKHQLIETDYDNGYFIIRNYIKNDKERNFENDYGIRLIEQDGSPSILWRQIKDKDYFLRFKTYSVPKKIKPKRSEKQLLSCSFSRFKLNLSDYVTTERRKNRRKNSV